MAVNFTTVAKIIKLYQIIFLLHLIFTAVKFTIVKVSASLYIDIACTLH